MVGAAPVHLPAGHPLMMAMKGMKGVETVVYGWEDSGRGHGGVGGFPPQHRRKVRGGMPTPHFHVSLHSAVGDTPRRDHYRHFFGSPQGLERRDRCSGCATGCLSGRHRAPLYRLSSNMKCCAGLVQLSIRTRGAPCSPEAGQLYCGPQLGEFTGM